VFLTTGSDVLANVITGVALVEASAAEISFYFGCVAQATGMGGAGLFVGSLDDASVRSVYELHGNDSETVGAVRAGSMFLAESSMCDVPAIWAGIIGRNAAVRVAPLWSCFAVAFVLLVPAASLNSC